jgi:serine/threonine protein kinase
LLVCSSAAVKYREPPFVACFHKVARVNLAGGLLGHEHSNTAPFMLASEISRSRDVAELLRSHGNACLVAFSDAIKQPSAPTIESFLKARPEKDRSQLAGLIAIEMRHRLELNEPCRVEGYLERFPELEQDQDQMVDLIYAEYCARRSSDPGVSEQEYFERFPSFREKLERAFRVAGAWVSLAGVQEDSPDHHSISQVQDTFLDFRLLGPIGSGAFAHVHLAEQTILSNRRVVLKATSLHTIEHRTMARLEHPNIVPILSVHHDAATNLQAVCMPYQYASALSDVRKEWSDKDLASLRGEEYMRAVRIRVPAEFRKDLAEPTDAAFPKQQTFVYASAWIMHKLAGALHHAHERGVYHRDLKPSNILLSVTGQPLLVDFNLSFSRLDSRSDAPQLIGGTLPYMPPEQILAVHPIEQGRVDDVGSRSDVFALGVTIFELLTGRLPFGLPDRAVDRLTSMQTQLARRYEPIPSARDFNASVPADFDALLRKCLAPQPHQRYDSAAELAEDLRLFLEDRPLRYIPAQSGLVRLQKFARRNRRQLAAGAAIVAIIIAVSTFVAHADLKARREQQARLKSEFQVSQYETSAEKEADAALSRTLLNPDDGKNYYRCFLMGREYFMARKYLHTNRCMSRVIQLKPEYSPAYYFRGRCHANLDEDELALADYANAIEHDPRDMYAHIVRAICYATSPTHSDPQLAIRDLDKTIELMPETVTERTKQVYLELARIMSAVSRMMPQEEEKEKALVRAEEYLIRAFDLGLELSFLYETNTYDRYRMLDPVFQRPNIQKFILQSPNKHRSDK